jgi:hypothetical protein
MKTLVLSIACLSLLIIACAAPGGGTTTTTTSADPVIGLWSSPGDGFDYGPQVISIRGDGGWYSGQMSATGSNALTSAGTWSRLAGGYTISTYVSPDSSAPYPMLFSGALSADNANLTLWGFANGMPMQLVFDKQAAPAADPIQGVWELFDPGITNVTAGALSFSSDGSWVCGQIQGTVGAYSAATITGTWTKTASDYALEVYQGTAATPMSQTGTLSAGTFTVDVSGISFTKRSTPASDPAVGLWVMSHTENMSSPAPVSLFLSVSADGSWFTGEIDDADGTYVSKASLGTWQNDGGGGYTITVHQTDGSTPDPMTLGGGLSTDGRTFTLVIVPGETPAYIEFTKM